VIGVLHHFSRFDSPFLKEASAQQRCEQRRQRKRAVERTGARIAGRTGGYVRLRRQFVWQIEGKMQ